MQTFRSQSASECTTSTSCQNCVWIQYFNPSWLKPVVHASGPLGVWQGVVTHILHIEALWPWSRTLIGENQPSLLDCSLLQRHSTVQFDGGSKDKNIATLSHSGFVLIPWSASKKHGSLDSILIPVANTSSGNTYVTTPCITLMSWWLWSNATVKALGDENWNVASFHSPGTRWVQQSRGREWGEDEIVVLLYNY